MTAFSAYFLPKLPKIVQEDVRFSIARRKKRGNPTKENIERFTDEAIKHALKWAPKIEDKFSFVDERRNSVDTPRHHSAVRNSIQLSHEILMCDDALKHLATNLTERFTREIGLIELNEEEPDCYFDGLKYAFLKMSEIMETVYIKPPQIKRKHKCIRDAERELERAIRRCLDIDYLVRKFKFLRSQYIEHSQIALDRVGEGKGQRKYVSARSFSRWEKKQKEGEQFVQSMSVVSEETGDSFKLSDVVERTTANPKNRRIELVVRSRGDEERAIDLGYVGVFITWTLPSKYHRNSKKWNGCTVKEAHQNIMEQWKLARAWFKKLEIDWFGLRVAEPHKDGTPHAHLFLYVHPSQKQQLIEICETIARNEDSDELVSAEIEEKRFLAKEGDPSKGTATGYIIKYICKNIDGEHLPEKDADSNALSARAWASTHRIKQFSQSGAPAVGLWRQLRRASKLDTAFDEELERLRDDADNSRWKGFCELGHKAKLAYEEKFNKYGDTVKRVIGIDWLGKIIETCSEHYSLVKTKDLKRRAAASKEADASPWSTENKCNQHLIEALTRATGWSERGVQCLIEPLKKGAKVPIDKFMTLALRNGRLIQT